MEERGIDIAASVLLDNPMSRRHFLAAAGSFSVATVLAACGTSTGTTSGTRQWAKAPITFVFVDTQEPSHLDPALVNEFDAFSIIRNIYDPLTWTDEASSKLVPWLATSWESSADALTHTFHLRSGVVFHDGSKLDADTVKLNLDRYKAIGAPGEGYLLDDVAEISVVDSMTVRIRTSKPDTWVAAHLVKFPILSGQAIQQNKTASDPWAKTFFEAHPVGCGAYKFDSWQKGSQITLTKNEQWWRGWRPGSIDRVIIKPVTESSTRVELVQRGEANFCTEWSIDDALAVGKRSGFSLKQYNTYDTDPIIFMNQKKPPFDKKLVRQAFQWAFDYDAMRNFFKGYSTAMAGTFPPSYPQAAKDLPTFKQDPAKARSLLSQAGVDPASLDISFMTPTGYNDLVAGATITQASLQKIGVKVSVRQLPFGQIVSAFSSPTTAAMMTDLYNSPFTLDPTQFLAEYLPTAFAHSFSNYDNPEVPKLIDKIQSTGDAATQQTLLNEVQHKLVDDAPCIWGGTPKTLVVVPDYLDGYVMQTTDYRFPCLFYLLRVAAH